LEGAKVPVPIERFISNAELVQHTERDIADRLREAIGDTRITLTNTFCGCFAFDRDVNDEPIVTANAEQAIDNALAPLERLLDALERKARRA
jgi:hypothetical protein